MASSISDLTRRKALASAAFWKWEKIWRRLNNLSCYQNQAVQHHLCDSALIWMWILGTVCQHAKQDKCIRYILLQDHAKYQCKQCKNPWDDEHPAPHQHCKTAPTAKFQHCGFQPSSSRRWCQLTHLPNCSGFSISMYNNSNDDTDLLVLLCFHPNSFNLYLRSEAKGHYTELPFLIVALTGSSEYGIFCLQKALGPETCHFFPFIYTTLQAVVPHQGCWELEKEQLRKSWEFIVTSKNKLK